MPPTEDVNAAVEQIMKPFDENGDNKHAFWDYWTLGGRWGGNKTLASIDPARLEEFHQWMCSEDVTVSSFVAGKQSLSPASQVPKVDAKWNDMFPSPDGKSRPCPIFDHSNDSRSMMDDDICPISYALKVRCSHIIFAGPSYDHDKNDWVGPLEATFILESGSWNGVNHMPVKWDRTVEDALNQFREKLADYVDGYKAVIEPQDDWIAVTVDYHS